MRKKILYLDMDGVLADFNEAVYSYFPELHKYKGEELGEKIHEYCEFVPEIFHHLKPLPGAIEAAKELFNHFDVYFLSTPMWNVPHSYTGKRLWLETHFGTQAEKKLILTHRKDLAIGDYLVDDNLWNGAEDFMGNRIHFGTDKFPDWQTTLNYLKSVA